MTTINADELLELIIEYGDARARVPNETNRHHAAGILRTIVGRIGPGPTELAERYRGGESLTAIARNAGLSYHAVRSMIISTGTPMRAQGRPSKGRNTK